MGRTAVLEEFEVEFYVLGKALFLCLRLKNVVSVLTLRTGGDLYTAPDKVVALGHTVLVTHMIEGSFLCIVVGDEKELVIKHIAAELLGHSLSLGGKVALKLVGNGIAVSCLKLGINVLKLHSGERKGGNGKLLTVKLLQLVRMLLVYLFNSVGNKFLLELHDVLKALDIGELKVEAGELGRMLVGVGLLCSEYGAGLKNTFKAGCHSHLLIELGRLRKVCGGIKILYRKNVRAGLACRSDKLRCVDLYEVTLNEELTHSGGKGGLKP